MPDETVHVLGAGIVGICTALSLLEKGFAVELIDRNDLASGASFGNAGVISPWSCVPQSMPGLWKQVPKWLFDPDGPLSLRWSYAPRMLPWLRRFLKAGSHENLPAIAQAMNTLNRPNVELYTQHLKGTGHEHLLQDSLYVHAYRNAADADLNKLSWRIRAEHGVPVERITQGELQEVEPEISPEYQAAILIKDQARAIDPGALGRALMDKALKMGARFRRTEVLALRPDGDGWSLDTTDGPIAAHKLVMAAGAWSARLLEPLGLKLPLEAERGYHLMFANPGITVNNSVMDVDGKFVASAMIDGIRCAGTAEFVGLDAPPNYARAYVFAKLAKRLFPRLDTSDVTPWMGTRPSFPDSLPMIGELPNHRGLFAAFGHCHYGLGMAPNTGRIVAGIIAKEPTNLDLAPYSTTRFS